MDQSGFVKIAAACDTVAATYEKLGDHFVNADPELSRLADQCAVHLRALEAVLLDRACNEPLRR